MVMPRPLFAHTQRKISYIKLIFFVFSIVKYVYMFVVVASVIIIVFVVVAVAVVIVFLFVAFPLSFLSALCPIFFYFFHCN